MRSGGNDFNYFKLTKLANFVQFKRMLMYCLEDWEEGLPPPWLRHWKGRNLTVGHNAPRSKPPNRNVFSSRLNCSKLKSFCLR